MRILRSLLHLYRSFHFLSTVNRIYNIDENQTFRIGELRLMSGDEADAHTEKTITTVMIPILS